LPFHMFIVVNFVQYDIPYTVPLRLGPLHPLASRNRRLNGVVLQMRLEKRKPCVTAGVER
jgi:hypothetical protein